MIPGANNYRFLEKNLSDIGQVFPRPFLFRWRWQQIIFFFFTSCVIQPSMSLKYEAADHGGGGCGALRPGSYEARDNVPSDSEESKALGICYCKVLRGGSFL